LSSLEFGVLGPLEIVAGGRGLPLRAAKQKTILALLLLHRGEVVSVDRLQEALWGERPPATAATALQGYVSQLRRMLEAAEEGGSSLLVTRSPGYSLTAAPEQLDVGRFEQLATSGREAFATGEPARAATLLAEALALWRGAPLADFSYEAWAQAAIGRLEELRLSVLEDRIEADLAGGRHGELVGELESLIAEQPLRERLRCQLMLALYRGGRQADALEAYQAARGTLVQELGIEPSPQLLELNRLILNHDPSLAPPERVTTSGPIIVLPVPPTPLVGREHELEELVELLKGDEVRLLTLTGTGGTGKTRLALEVAAELVEEYPDGVFFVSLAPIRDPALVIPTIAQTLSVKEEAGKPVAATLARELELKTLLLFLDNFEQVVDAAPGVAELLERAPKLTILATSREPLHLGAEHEYAVPPLAGARAVELFRARAANGEPLAAVAEICRRLDGLPLAIELAAARTKVLPPTNLLERIEKRLPLLTGTRRDSPARQQTLRATIAWSYDLLSSEERQLFACLAVFAGGCALEAAESICEAELDTLQSLVEKSLLRHTAERFWMLETISEYATERLDESNEAPELRQRHADWYLDLAERAYPEMRGPDQANWLERLEQEHANFRSILGRDISAGESEAALLLASLLSRFWIARGYLAEGSRWLETCLESAGTSAARSRALRGQAILSMEQGQIDRAAEAAKEALALDRASGDEDGAAHSMGILADVVAYRGDLIAAEGLYEEAAELARRRGDRLELAITLYNLGHLARLQHDLLRAGELFEEALATFREVGDALGQAAVLQGLVEVASESGDHERAFAFLRVSTELHKEIQYVSGLLDCLGTWADLLARRGEAETAARLWGAYHVLGEEVGRRREHPLEAAAREESAGAVREALGDQLFERAWTEGGRLTLDQALALALEQGPAANVGGSPTAGHSSPSSVM
jgi:predicted ATPase/DNA-binding SARP family transcriptional activator